MQDISIKQYPLLVTTEYLDTDARETVLQEIDKLLSAEAGTEDVTMRKILLQETL